MKKCPKCENTYINDMQDCPSCGVVLEEYEDATIFEPSNEKHKTIRDVTHNCMSKIKIYHAVIICIVLVALVFASYMCGIAKKYDEAYITQTFQNKKNEFNDLLEQQTVYDKHKSTRESLNTEITEIQKKIDTITAFEEKRDAYNSEIQNLSTQINSLSLQKTQKEETLSNIENEISQY